MAYSMEMRGMTFKKLSNALFKLVYTCRSSMVGADLNRVWNDFSEYFHPTVKAAMDAIQHLDDQPVLPFHWCFYVMVIGK